MLLYAACVLFFCHCLSSLVVRTSNYYSANLELESQLVIWGWETSRLWPKSSLCGVPYRQSCGHVKTIASMDYRLCPSSLLFTMITWNVQGTEATKKFYTLQASPAPCGKELIYKISKRPVHSLCYWRWEQSLLTCVGKEVPKPCTPEGPGERELLCTTTGVGLFPSDILTVWDDLMAIE